MQPRMPGTDPAIEVSSTLPQAFFAAILIVALALMGRAAIHTNARLYQSQVLQATTAFDVVRTSVAVESVTPATPPERLTIGLRNKGKRDISGWAAFDLLVNYETTVGPVTEFLAFTDGTLAPGTWTINAGAAGDEYEPGILNLDEAVQLEAVLSNTPLPGSAARVSLTLEGGSTFSQTFVFP